MPSPSGRLSTVRSKWLAVFLSGAFAVGISDLSKAASPEREQIIELRAGSNLISLQVAAPISLGDFRGTLADPAFLKEVWEYRPGAAGPGTWNFAKLPAIQGFPSDLEDDELKPGRGYWVNVSQYAVSTTGIESRLFAIVELLTPN